MPLGLTYPTYDKVEELIQSDFYLSAENSENNYECMKHIFYNYNNKETVQKWANR